MLADRLERHRGIRLPDANVPLLLWRLTREIGGTRGSVVALRRPGLTSPQPLFIHIPSACCNASTFP